MTPAEKRKAKLEAQTAEMREESKLNKLGKSQGLYQPKVSNAFKDYNEDPLNAGFTHTQVAEEIAHKKASRGPDGAIGIDEWATRKKELTFNTYLSQMEEQRSFINLLPPALREAVLVLPEELVGVDEDTLLPLLKEKYNYTPTAAAEAMRMNFWIEHDRVATTRTEVMLQGNIYLGVVERAYFHKIIHERPPILAYILCRPPEYEAVMRGLLNLSTRRIRDVLNIPLQKPTGELQDPKVIELVLKAAAMVDLRAKGGYTMRSETKNLNLVKQETTSYTTVFNAASSNKPTDLKALTANIDEKIAALEKEMSAVAGQLTDQISQQAPPVPEPEPVSTRITPADIQDAEFKEQF
jgi:hypothetical protein